MKTLFLHVCLLLVILLIPSCDQNSHEPEIADQTFHLDENSKSGTLVGKIKADDLDEQQTLSFEIIEGNTNNVFTLDRETGDLIVNNTSVLDYEKIKKIGLQVLVSDNHPNDPLESSANISIVLNNLNEFAPVIEDQAFTVDERSISGTVIGNIVATDPDSGQILSFQIQSGNDNQVVQLDSLTGEISIKDSAWFNYSINQELILMVSVSDNDAKQPLQSYAMITIEILDVPFVILDISGYVQKGPFILGSQITISELTQDLQPTGKVFSTQIADNSGKFDIPDVELESPYILIKADGFYFNERTGELSEAQLSLNSLVDITDMESFNINVIAHLEKDRMVELMNDGMGFTDAKVQAKREILGIFGFESVDQLLSEQMDIANSGEDNAILLATSLILQGYRTTGEFSEIMSRIILDFKEDGSLDSESIGTELINGINTANLQTIRQYIEQRYNGLGMDYEIPDFEKYVNQFTERTDFVATNDFIFPKEGIYGINALQYDITKVEAYYVNENEYSFTFEVPEDRSLMVKVIGYGCGYNWGSEINMNHYTISEPVRYHTFTSISSGTCDVGIRFIEDGLAPPQMLTFEYYQDGNTDPYFVKEVEVLTNTVPVDSTLLR